MKNAEEYTDSVTQMFYKMVMHAVHSEHPDLIPGKGRIIYDDENEEYVYSGFTEEELKFVRNAVRELAKNNITNTQAA